MKNLNQSYFIKFYQTEYELKLQNEYLESKLEEYDNVLSDMEKLQLKLADYERKLNKHEFKEDKKDNEILILRAENSNLKNCIVDTEKNFENLKIKFSEYKKEKDYILHKNKEIIHKLSKSIKKYEENPFIQKNQISISDKLEKFNSKSLLDINYKSNTNFNTMRPHSSRKNSCTGNQIFLSADKKNISKEKIIENNTIRSSNENKKQQNPREKKSTDLKNEIYKNLFEKINPSSKGQKVEKNKSKESQEKNVYFFS